MYSTASETDGKGAAGYVPKYGGEESAEAGGTRMPVTMLSRCSVQACGELYLQLPKPSFVGSV